MATLRPITFLSDYGYDDEFVGVCRAVLVRTTPGVEVIDLTHGIPPHDILAGASALARSLPFCPPGVHLAVVDPGVGTERRPVAVEVADQGRILVGPDNGLLSHAIRRLGGAVAAVDITESRFRAEVVSKTFHGRDLFAPIAARLAAGYTLDEVGDRFSPESLIMPPALEPELHAEHVLAHVVSIDRYGNATLDTALSELAGHPLAAAEQILIEAGGRRRSAKRGLRFADVAPNELVVYEDSASSLAIAVNRGDAAAALGLEPGVEVTLRADV